MRLLQMGLTVIVPYLVSTASSVGAIREARSAHHTQQPGHSQTNLYTE